MTLQRHLDQEYVLSALYLALAAPSLYAPCLRFAKVIPDDPQHRVQCYLILPLRNGDRTLCTGAVPDQVLHISRKWTLLPVPWAQLPAFWIADHAGGMPVPPRSSVLTLKGTVSWADIELPESLADLQLIRVAAPGPVSLHNVFAHVLPSLRFLYVVDGFDHDSGPAPLCQLLTHVPETLSLLFMFTEQRPVLSTTDLVTLAMVIPHLASLSSVFLGWCRPTGLDAVLLALPRFGLKALGLLLNLQESDPDALARPVPSFPNLVQELIFEVQGDVSQPAIDALIHHLPVANKTLGIIFPSWTLSMFQNLPFAPTLQNLTVRQPMNQCHQHPTGLECLIDRFLVTLTFLDLSYFNLSATPALAVLARHLPPQLTTLHLRSCHLNDADLAQFSGKWPAQLRDLYLASNYFTAMPVKWPPRLVWLNLHDNVFLEDVHSARWVALLPRTLRKLVVSKCAQLGACLPRR
ncbi:hypothetical protein GGF32_010016 [Allomyces javanicus]|nr:hypothetical protein GGF32_010016 [Allomyces javanicus]